MHTAIARRALTSVLSKYFGRHLPHTAYRLAICLLDERTLNSANGASDVADSEVRLKVEAAGAGVVLIPSLTVAKSATVYNVAHDVFARLGFTDGIMYVGHGSEPLLTSDRSEMTVEQAGWETGTVLVVMERAEIGLASKWKSKIRRQAAHLKKVTAKLTRAVIVRGGKRLVSTTQDGELNLHSLQCGKLVRTYPFRPAMDAQRYQLVDLSPVASDGDKDFVLALMQDTATPTQSYTVHLCSLHDGQCKQISRRLGFPATAAVMSDDRGTVVVRETNGTVRVWSNLLQPSGGGGGGGSLDSSDHRLMVSTRPTLVLPRPASAMWLGRGPSGLTLAVADGDVKITLYTGESMSSTTHISPSWGVEFGPKQQGKNKRRVLLPKRRIVVPACFSEDGNFVAIATAPHTASQCVVRVVSLADHSGGAGGRVYEFETADNTLTQIALSQSGKYVAATQSRPGGGGAKVWEVATGVLVLSVPQSYYDWHITRTFVGFVRESYVVLWDRARVADGEKVTMCALPPTTELTTSE